MHYVASIFLLPKRSHDYGRSATRTGRSLASDIEEVIVFLQRRQGCPGPRRRALEPFNIPQSAIRRDGERVFRSRSPWCSYADGGLPKIWKGHSLVQLAPGRAIHGLLATEVTRRPIVTDRPPALPYMQIV